MHLFLARYAANAVWLALSVHCVDVWSRAGHAAVRISVSRRSAQL